MADRPAHDELRSRRNAARAALDARIARVKGDVEARGVGGRIADTVTQEARAGLDQALDIAKESKGIIAGTAALLALWFLRNPIVGWVEGLLAERDTDVARGGEEEREDD